MAFQHQESSTSSFKFLDDGLFCEEQCLQEDELDFDYFEITKNSHSSSFLLQQDLFWEDNELLNLISKEKDTHFNKDSILGVNGSSLNGLVTARKESIEWVFRVKAHYGFTALTCVLAVNYFDRFLFTLRNFQNDKPWLCQLAAVACLSLAAKVEETHVPLLLDFQVEDAKFVFEAKTIKRMELLVLSNLQWRMNPVTPISFFDHIIRRLGLNNHLHWEFLRMCEGLLLSVISDLRVMSYLPSVLATAIMLHVIKEVEPRNQVEYQSELMSVMKISEEKMNECYKLIMELLGVKNQSCKRKHSSIPGSPSGVIDAYFSSDSSNDSWISSSSTITSSPLPLFKRSRMQDQQMRLPSINRMFVDVLSSPH